MASKNLSIRMELTEKLVKIKEKNESFSDLIERLLNEGSKGSSSRLMKYFGTWSELPEDLDKKIIEFRKSINENIESCVKERLNDFLR